MALPPKKSKKPIQKKREITPTELVIFAEFLGRNQIFIVDSSGASRSRLTKILVELGAKASSIFEYGGYESAEAEMRKLRPRIVLCDYYLGKRSGFDLLRSQREEYPDPKECFFVLISANASQSAVARAAEEDVDTYILKPYTLASLKELMVASAVDKLNPNEYIRTIEAGKRQLFAGEFGGALELFKRAMTLHRQPTLACFYAGQAESMQKEVEQAIGHYRKGLTFNKLHYKCLVALHDELLARKEYVDAYEIVRRIAKFFPANPKRLASVLRLAVITENFEDIEEYYRIFIDLDERPEELLNHVCAATVVSGKFFLLRKQKDRALEAFKRASVSAAGRTQFLLRIIEILVEFGCHENAGEFLKAFPAQTHTQDDYRVANYLAGENSGDPTKVIQTGRELIRSGIHRYSIYRSLINRSRSAGFQESVADLLTEANRRWPEQASELQGLSAA